MKILYKILNRLKVLKFFNVDLKISAKNKKFHIPIIQGIGITNINHKESWFTDILFRFNDYYKNITFLDIGANIGQTLLNVKTVNPEWKYLGFEPNSTCLFYLKKLIRKNNFQNVKLFPVAISSSLSILELNSLNEVDSSATIVDEFRGNYYKNGYKEIVIGLDINKILVPNFNKEINYLIKIDIEGAELQAISGMIKFLNLSRAFIICEVLDTHSEETINNHKERLEKLELLLKENKYNIYQILRNERTIFSLKFIENFEVKIWSSESTLLNDFLFVPIEKETILTNFYKIDNHI